jgi:flagellar hook-associated protein 1 FlgK
MSGYDLYGNIGETFFTPGTTAQNMQVSDAIVNDNGKIAASATVNADGDNASAIAAIQNDTMYASLGRITTSTIAVASATGTINNVGQVYKDTSAPIVLTRGATPGTWTVTNNGGYGSLNVLSADNNTVTLDLNGNGTAGITLNLTGTWQATDTISFSLAKSGAETINNYYSTFIAKVGQDTSAASNDLDRQTSIFNQLTDQREQISGVSLDEEMMNLIKYQMSYSAAGRLINTVSQLMDTLVNLGQG